MVQLSPSSICCGRSLTSIDVRLCGSEDSIDGKATWLVSLENSSEPAFPGVQLSCDAAAGRTVVTIRYVLLSDYLGAFVGVGAPGCGEPARDLNRFEN